MSGCPRREELAAFMAGDLDGAFAHALEAHLDGCPTCRAAVEGESGFDPLLGDLRQALDSMGLPIETAEVDVAPARYRILRRIGEGGMGVVYAAEQQHPERLVALKVIRPGLSSDDGLRRFEQEARVLGLLQHPGIAQIHEAGAFTAGGRRVPFLAMELVDGVSLSQFVSENAPARAARLRLFVAICAAVQHAHQKGVIHRDLKPGNVLVTAAGEPKVLDFGVARVVDAEATLQTQAGQIVGTLPYMSPEQLSSDPADLDTRADVYALGAILYELLTGQLPLDVVGKPVTEAMRVIAADRPRAAGALDSSLAGDLETIIDKALEKERERRYDSAAALAEDVDRFLRHEPINARPPSRSYQLRLFARRNRVLVGGVIATFVVLVAGIITTYGQMRRAWIAEGEASTALAELRGEAMSAEAAMDFLAEVLMQAAPGTGPRPDSAATRATLERAASLVDAQLAAYPAVRAKVHHVLGDALTDLGDTKDGEVHLDAALAVYEQLHGKNHRRIAYVLTSLAQNLERQARFEDAKAAATRALAMREVLPQHMADLVPKCLRRLSRAEFNLGDLDGAIARMEAAVAAQQALDPDAEFHAIVLGDLAVLYGQHKRPDEAEPLLRRALALQQKRNGVGHVSTARLLGDLANLRSAQGELEEAQQLREQELAICREAYGDDSRATATVQRSLGLLLWERDQRVAAEVALRGALASYRAIDAAHPDVLHSLNILGWMNAGLERPEAGEKVLREAVTLAAKFPADHILALRARQALGALLVHTARVEEGVKHLEHVVEHAPPEAFWAQPMIRKAQQELEFAKDQRR